MRNIKYVGLVLVLGLALAGCGQVKQDITVVPFKNETVPVVQDNSSSTTQTPTAEKTYTLAEVAVHNKSNDCWQVIDGKVYDVTKYVPAHPGGPQIIKGCGADASAMYNGVGKHANAKAKLAELLIGTLK